MTFPTNLTFGSTGQLKGEVTGWFGSTVIRDGTACVMTHASEI
jgi:hypothetical protein